MKWILLVLILISCNQDDDMRLFVSSLSNSGETPPPVSANFRSACYNIWEGGTRGSGGKDMVLKLIDRMGADFLTICESGDSPSTNLKPLLEARGYTDFYGTGGTYELYYASKYPIVYSALISNQGWNRKPLYCEMEVDGNLVGVISVHLDSSCGGLCRVPDYENNVPFEPAAQRRCIQVYQIMDFMNARMSAQPLLKGFIMQGDYNAVHNELNVVEYTTPLGDETLPSGLSYPLANAQWPYKEFEFFSHGTMDLATPTGLGGEIYTWANVAQGNENPAADSGFYPIDYQAVSNGLSFLGSEILNSKSDANTGLTKYGEPLDPTDSFTSSDHLPVFADIKIL